MRGMLDIAILNYKVGNSFLNDNNMIMRAIWIILLKLGNL